jgi:membrane protease YdiL (CAAX protease family)
MIGFALVVGFPLILGLGYGLAYLVFALLTPSRSAEMLGRWGGAIYLMLMTAPLAGVLAFLWLGHAPVSPRQLGIWLPTLAPLPDWLAAALCIPLAMVLGRVLFMIELLLSVQVQRLLGRHAGVSAALEGQSSQLASHVPPLTHYLASSTPIVLMEEFLWRGFLIYFLIRYLHMPTLPAVGVAAVSFGLNHFYFGLRNVALKTMDGLIWGFILVWTSSLLGPILSHLTFQYFVWRRLDRRARAARGAA